MSTHSTISREQLALDQKTLVRASILLTGENDEIADELIKIKVRYQIIANERFNVEGSTVS